MYSWLKLPISKNKTESITLTPSNNILSDVYSPEANIQLVSQETMLCKSLLSGLNVIESIRDALLQSSEQLNNELATIDAINHKNELTRQDMIQLTQIVT